MKKCNAIIILLIIQLSIILVVPLSANASDDMDVNIKLLSSDTVFTSTIEPEVQVEFLNKDLFNKDVFLAYHVYDENDNEVLFEGTRNPIEVDESYNSKIKFNIDLNSGIDLKRYNYLKVRFDIIDQSKPYWFSKNENIKINACEIIYENNFMKKCIYLYKEILKEQGITFIVNLSVFIAMIYLGVKFKKNYSG